MFLQLLFLALCVGIVYGMVWALRSGKGPDHPKGGWNPGNGRPYHGPPPRPLKGPRGGGWVPDYVPEEWIEPALGPRRLTKVPYPKEGIS